MIAIETMAYFVAVPACIGSVVALVWEAYHR
jgi:hypothetical protein